MALSNIAGFPRIGPNRELKFAAEDYWRGEVSAEQLAATGSEIRRANWKLMQEAGIDLIPSNDFSHYDQVLDTVALVGAVPERYEHSGGDVDLDTYFAMARGRQGDGVDVTAMEMTKWFDTNYHYIVPELGPDTRFALSSSKPFDEFVEAQQELGLTTVPVLLGPVSFLLLAKPGDGVDEHFDRLSLIEPLLSVYGEVIERLAEHGADWVQLDEPCFVMDREERDFDALRLAYEELPKVHERTRLLVKTYFDHVGDAYAVLRETPVDGIGLDFSGAAERSEPGPDFIAARQNVAIAREVGPLEGKTLFAGLVDGRNVWINDLHASLEELEHLEELADEVVVSTSCSLLHTPVDLDAEQDLDDELRSWMAFATQKVREVAVLAKGHGEGREAIESELADNVEAMESRAASERTRNPEIRRRVESLTAEDAKRASPFEARREAQRADLGLPQFPTTTIGSYPQTQEIRSARAELREGKIDEAEYERRMKSEIERVIRFQEEVGLDVLVHGEPERNDMVQYFAEQMDGYAFTQNAWVQSYGSRCVRPPILYGDVSRPNPMTVEWILYAQSLTERPVKGMLTGPVTMLQWSFVRDDQPREDTCMQLALAIRDEVHDLADAGVQIIQVDEPAIREGLPLRRERWDEYLEWAVRCFRITTSGVEDAVQIQTHMCYSDFGDIMDRIQEMDADVLLIEAARSRMALLHEWERSGYKQEIGPGVYDIHSPRVPPAEEMAQLLEAASDVLRAEQIWVNPDCGLKTRAWPETEAALRNMVDAARQAREQLVPAG